MESVRPSLYWAVSAAITSKLVNGTCPVPVESKSPVASALSIPVKPNHRQSRYRCRAFPQERKLPLAAIEALCGASAKCVEKTLLICMERRITMTADHGNELKIYVTSTYRSAKGDWDAFLQSLARFQRASSRVMEELQF